MYDVYTDHAQSTSPAWTPWKKELGELLAELDRPIGDPTRVPTPVDGVLDVLNAVIEMMALVLKVRREGRERDR